MLTTIPFSGFYESLHDSQIDDCVEGMFQDDSGNRIFPELAERLFRSCDFHQVYEKYAADYTAAFAHEFGLKSLVFESLSSPREYNFTTDRIFATIDESEVLDLLGRVDLDAFAAQVKERFTSYDGFMSFYSPDIGTWGPPAEWDHNQVGTLLLAHANEQSNEDFDHWAEFALMSDLSGSGDLDNWIWEATPEAKRLYRIFEYLQTRAARCELTA